MGNAKKILKTRAKEFFSLWRHYSFLYAVHNAIWWFCFYTRPPFCYRLSTFALKKKTAWLDKYIERKYKHIIDKYRKPLPTNADTITGEPTIWVFWGQGEENMPPLVKVCYRQLANNNKNVTLVTNKNINKYIALPETIFDKVKSGKISWANYSDIIRTTLLAKYGGLWIDATVWVSGKVPFNKLNRLKIFSANGKIEPSPRAIRFWTSFEYNWSTWCLWSKKSNNILYSFVSNMLTAIAEHEDVWPDYVIQDYLIYYTSRHFPVVDTMLNEMNSIVCDKRNELASIMNEEYNEEQYNELIKDNHFFKLSFRAGWKEQTKEGKKTFYGHLISNTNNIQ